MANLIDNEELLAAEVAILTGGVDIDGQPIIAFPDGVIQQLEPSCMTDLLKLLELYRSVGEVYQTVGGSKFTILANLQHGCSNMAIDLFVEVLDMFECNRRGSISSVILLKPARKRKVAFLENRLANKNTSGRIFPFYTVHLIESFEELCNLVEPRQLTLDYGGTLQYNHVAWVDFQKSYFRVIKNAMALNDEMQSIHDYVTGLRDTKEQALSSAAIVYRRKEIRARYESVLEKHHAREVVQSCRQSLEELENPETDSTLIQIHASLLLDAVTSIRSLYLELTQHLEELDTSVDKIDADLAVKHKLEECRERTLKVKDAIASTWSRLRHHPRVGKTRPQAETYRAQFQHTILNPSKCIIAKATAILLDLDTGKNTTPRSYNAALEIAKGLAETIQPFTVELNTVNEDYIKINVFHVVLQKTIHWKRKAQSFIIRSFPVVDLTRSGGLMAPVDWEESMERFHSKHPGPRRKHLILLTKDIPCGVEARLIQHTACIVEKTRFIRKLFNKKTLSTEELRCIISWQEEDDVDSDSSATTNQYQWLHPGNPELSLQSDEISADEDGVVTLV